MPKWWYFRSSPWCTLAIRSNSAWLTIRVGPVRLHILRSMTGG